MNANEAIKAHTDWKIRLQMAVTGKNGGQLNPNEIGLDNKCPLGQWIYASAFKDIGKNPDFTQLKEAHAAFHRAAADIVKLMKVEDYAQAQQALNDSRSEFNVKAHDVVRQITKLKPLMEAH
ncbi:MAG TPA: CZB domain-containing protein [Candidatus Paceibacterota bacterium]|nr:CZB domain-containing protein [Candidatus Paceibacterota bacterium]